MSSNLDHALKHMNEDHKDSLFNLVKFHKGVTPKEVELVHIDYDGMKIKYDDEFLELKYSERADEKTLHFAVIELCKKAKPAEDKLDKQIDEYKRSFKSVIIASVDSNGNAISSYAPIIFDNDDMYVFISEVAEHYHALKANPDKAEIMFLQDEKEAKTIFARIRLRYKVTATILDRDNDFDRLFALMKEQHKNEHVDMFYGIKDFHFVKLSPKNGRFVKGFGAAYEIDENGKAAAVRIEKPHKMN